MADAFGSTLLGKEEKSFRHYGAGLDFPQAARRALNLPLCISVCAFFVCVRLVRGEE